MRLRFTEMRLHSNRFLVALILYILSTTVLNSQEANSGSPQCERFHRSASPKTRLEAVPDSNNKLLEIPWVSEFKQEWTFDWTKSSTRRYMLIVEVNYASPDGSFSELAGDEALNGQQLAQKFQKLKYGGFESN